MRQRALVIAAAAGLLLAGVIHATPQGSLDDQLSAAVARGDVPGLVVVAATRDRVAGVALMQVLPFADTRALAVLDTFERGVYQLADAP